MKTVDIIERIEGEAKLVCSWENSRISDARIEFLNFRGFEYILKDKPALDTLIYTPRICGICGQAHLKATVEALENIYTNINEPLEVTNKAKLLREIGLNIEIIDSHIKWFYMFIMPDIAKLSSDIKYEKYKAIKGSQWLNASKITSEIIKSLAIIGGQWPHTSYMVPGGVMSDPTLLDLTSMQNYLDQAVIFFENSLAGVDIIDYLSFDNVDSLEKLNYTLKDFKNISFENELEKIGKSYDSHIVLASNSLFESAKIKTKNKHKIDISKVKEENINSFKVNSTKKDNEYTWSKTALYNNEFYETGPLSRALVSNRKFIKSIHKEYKDSVFTRVFARMDEFAHLLIKTKDLISKIDISQESYIKPKYSYSEIEHASSISTVEAARGSLYHKIIMEKGIIKSYDVITPTVWNLGPGINAKLGVAQKAIIGVDSLEKAQIILRSFDVCSVCTTH